MTDIPVPDPADIYGRMYDEMIAGEDGPDDPIDALAATVSNAIDSLPRGASPYEIALALHGLGVRIASSPAAPPQGAVDPEAAIARIGKLLAFGPLLELRYVPTGDELRWDEVCANLVAIRNAWPALVERLRAAESASKRLRGAHICAHCLEVFPVDESGHMPHTLTCEQNPMVARIATLEAALDRAIAHIETFSSGRAWLDSGPPEERIRTIRGGGA